MVSKNLKDKLEELSKLRYQATTTGKCVKCGTCITYCPLNLRKFNNKGTAVTIKTNSSCGGCSVCYHRCPQKAITLVLLNK